MSFTDDFLTSLEKEKKKTAEKKKKKTVTAGNSFTQEFLSKTDDIAPVASTPQLLLPVRTGVAPITAPVSVPKKEKKKDRTYFSAGALDDGITVGNIARSIIGSDADILENIGIGARKMAENAIDTGLTGVSMVGKVFGAEKFSDNVNKAIAKDILGESLSGSPLASKVASSLVPPQLRHLTSAAKGISELNTLINGDVDVDEVSLLGERADSLVQTGTQVMLTRGLGAKIPWQATVGVTSFGGAVEGALNEDATIDEAAVSGLVSAGGEVLSEYLLGGMFGETGLDDALVKSVSRNISNKTLRNVLKFSTKAGGEGLVEEPFSWAIQKVGEKLTYADEKTWKELFTSEEAVDELVESVVGGLFIGGVMQGADAVQAQQAGVDYTSGMTANEEAVVKKVYENSIAEAEKDGKKLTTKEKNKLYDSVVEDMDKGRISIDTIEEVLGGDTYKSYRETVDSEDALTKEFEELGNKQNATLAEQSRYNELKQQLEDMKQNSQRDTLKTKLGEEVFGLAKDSRLAESYAERDRRGQAFEADLTQYDVKQQEVVKRAVESGILNNTRRTHEFVDLISKISADKGVLFDFTNNEKLKASGFAVGGKTVDGYVTKDGITLNMDSPKAWQSTVGHEITHVLEGTELYDSLRTTIFEYAKSKGEYDSRLADIQERYKGIENADYEAELTSDLVGDYLFADENFIKHLSVNNRNVFQKIYDEVKYMLKVVTAGSKEARQLEKVKRAFDKVYKEGGKEQSDTKYSVSDSDGKQLSKEQQEFFKDSKMRDDNGNLKVMYHGSQDAGFHVFDARMSDDDTSFFFVDRNDVAASYSGTSETYEAKTIRTAEDMNNFLAEIGQDEDYSVVEKDGQFILLYDGDRVAASDTAQGIYEEFCWYEGVGEGDANYKVYLNLTNPLVVDAEGRNWNNLTGWSKAANLKTEDATVKRVGDEFRLYKNGQEVENASIVVNQHNQNMDTEVLKSIMVNKVNSILAITTEGKTTTREIAKWAKEQGYDGVIFKNIHDNGGYSNGSEGASTVAIAFDSNQIKSVANEKPTADKDIRYSLTEYTSPFRSLSDGKVHGKGVPLRDLRLETVAENATVEEAAPDITPVADNTVPEGFAPATEDEANAMRTEAFQTVDDGDMPPEMEAPYQPSQEVTVDDPFEDRDWYEVSNRKVKAYMYENPEVKPFFQEEAAVMLDELNSTTKGERWYDDHVYYDTGGEAGWGGTKRHTSESIAEMLDGWKMSYDDIEKGLKAIIEDHGAENIAAAKKIEFMLNERLLNGYTSFVGFEPTMDKWGNVPPNQSYLAMLEEKQVTEYSKEAFEALMAEADRYAPVGISETETTTPVAIAENATTTDDIAPVAPAFEVVSDKKGEIKGQQAITKEDAATGKTAKILVEEPEVEKKQSVWSKFKNLVLDKGMVFEDLSIRTGNRELQARWNSIRYARNKAQRLMEKGNASVSSLDSIRKTVEGKGKEYTQKFYEYLYHMHNIDRMSLETEENRVKREGLQVQFQGYTDEQLSDLATSWITKDTPQGTVDRIKAAREYVEAKKNGNKPVFGDDVTADISRKTASKMEAANPEFKEYAQEVYGYMKYLREMLVDNGVISKETAKLWDEMYPHYVPIRRLGDTGLNINVPLDTGRTGVNAPVKRATGGSRDILPLFDTMGQRTMQTFNAVAKNRFGVELKNTLGTTIGSEAMGLDEAIDSIDTQDGLLQEGKKGKKPTFTVFEDGKRVTFEITEEMYDAMKPTSDALAYTNKVASAVSDFRRNTLTQYNPWFMLKNAIKDVQDVLVNSQHAARTYATIPKAISQMASNGQWYTEYMENGGEDNSYFDSQTNTFEKPNPTIEAIKKYTGLNAIAKANNIIERLPRLAEYIASREAGRSVDVAMLDAARVTTNFAAGGDLTKFLNRNGATFLNASFQGAMQQVRNVREAKAAGVKGVLNLAAKFAVAGLPALALNALIWGDDDEYEELSDYVKQSYYIVGKTEDGKFIRIPKGRTVAVIQNGFEQMQHLITGDDEADLRTFLDLLLTNLAPNNPIDNNILSPIIDVAQNKTWYGEDLVPTRLQDVPNAEQYDESTDSLSRWLGETFNVSPYKTNYLLDQYGGIIGDTFLPMLTPEAESGNDTFVGNMIAPLKDMFTTDSVMNNQNVSDFYDTKDELTKAANSMYATDEDVLKAKYMNSVNSEMGKLYGEKRELQNSDMPDAEKYEAVREVQRQIDELAKSGLSTYNEVLVSGGYATVGDRHYRKKDGEWSKLTAEQLEKQEEVTSGLGISPADYWSDKEEYDFAYEKPEKYAVAKAVGGYDSYKDYSSELYDIKADKDENGDSIRNSRKEKVIDWVNNLDADYGTRIILFKSEYNADDTYNYDIIEYLNNRDDISYDDMVAILKELGFDVDANGNISWD